ncbi:MAG: hypothetical protein E7262_06095 [Lachnospiraceae bacterium]|nr:hypothetical protein [Lachnospiraceae bacterium]
MVVQNEIMNAASKQYSMSFVTKADIAQKYAEQNNEDATTDVAASMSLSNGAGNEIPAYTGVIDRAQEDITKNQVADMSLAEMNKKLYRITQLSIQAGYDGKSYNDKREIQEEIRQLRLEIQNIGYEADFNGEKIFAPYNPYVGNVNTSNVNTNIINDVSMQNAAGVYTSNNQVPKISIDYHEVLNTIDEIDVTKENGSKEALVHTNKAMDYIDDARKYISTEKNRLEQIIQGAVGAVI